jgi:hypothetical protein
MATVTFPVTNEPAPGHPGRRSTSGRSTSRWHLVTTPDKQSVNASKPTDQRSELMVEGVRALLWMNGGGAVGLAFLQAIWGKNPGFSQSNLRAAICFLLGVLLAGSVQVLRSTPAFHPQEGDEDWRKVRHVYLFAACASLVAFLAGVVAVVCGGYRALH